LIIGLTGSSGSGCTRIARFLEEEQNFHYFSLSEVIRKAIESKGEEPVNQDDLRKTRKRLQDKGDELRKGNPCYLIDHIHDGLITEKSKKVDVVIDGIKNHCEIEKLRQESPAFVLVAIDAPREIRWERCKDAYKGDQARFDEDDERDSGKDQPIYGQQVQKCVEQGDIFLVNDKQFRYPNEWNDFFAKVVSFIDLVREPGYRLPFPSEMFMAAAYMTSLRSSCTRRQVGAIIASRDDTGIISSGFNDVSRGRQKCRDLGGPTYCYIQYEAERKVREWKLCPFCGLELDFTKNPESLPRKCQRCAKKLPHDFVPGKMLDLCRALHAEEDAILQAANLGSTSLAGSTMYCTTLPCPLCAKKIVDVGILKIVYVEPYPMVETWDILEKRVETQKYEGVSARAFYSLFKRNLF